jgi:hypothetical protein
MGFELALLTEQIMRTSAAVAAMATFVALSANGIDGEACSQNRALTGDPLMPSWFQAEELKVDQFGRVQVPAERLGEKVFVRLAGDPSCCNSGCAQNKC